MPFNLLETDGTCQTYDFGAALVKLDPTMTVGEMVSDSNLSFPPEALEYVREAMEDVIDLHDALVAKEEAGYEGTISHADLKKELGL